MLPTRVARRARRACPVLLVLLLVSCGGEGGDGGDAARPSLSPTRTPTATLPSLELPTPTRSPTRTDDPGLPTPTRSVTRTDGPTAPADRPSEEPTAQETTPRAPVSTGPGGDEPAETPAANPPVEKPAEELPAEDSTEDEPVATWVWWLLAALVGGSLVAVPLVVRARRRHAWRRAVVATEAELAWFARELLPELRRAGSREQMVGGWTVGRARVVAAEDRLTALESTAFDDLGSQRVQSLRDAVRQARDDMEQLAGPEQHETWALELDAIIDDLEAALAPPPPASAE